MTDMTADLYCSSNLAHFLSGEHGVNKTKAL